MIQSSECSNLCEALYAFEKVHAFLSLVIIDDFEVANAFFNEETFTCETPKDQIGNRMITEFEYLSNKLYIAGMKTYLTERIQGDSETFYAHALRWYFPAILRQTYCKYGLGIGIYTMEGFEAINYFTKRMLRNHSNRKGNVCSQSMTKIVLAYMTHVHDVPKELAKRKKEKKKIIEKMKMIHHDSQQTAPLVQV